MKYLSGPVGAVGSTLVAVAAVGSIPGSGNTGNYQDFCRNFTFRPKEIYLPRGDIFL